MTLHQSLDTLLKLPELRLGILCANYLKKIEGLLPDVMDHNVDLINNPTDDSVTYYVQGKLLFIAKFAIQEVESLRNTPVMQIPCHASDLIISVPSSTVNWFNRPPVIPDVLRDAEYWSFS